MMDRRAPVMSIFGAFIDMSSECVDDDDISHAVGINPFDASKTRSMTRRLPQNGKMNFWHGSAGR